MANKHEKQRDFYKMKQEWVKELRNKSTIDQDENIQTGDGKIFNSTHNTDKTRLEDQEMRDTGL